jgi:copper transport protein
VHVTGSHANAPGSWRPAELLFQHAHVLAAGVWIGGLVWLLLALREGVTKNHVHRFSRLAAASLGIVIATGALRSIDELGGWNLVLGTSYAWTLGGKLFLAGLLMLGGLASRRRLFGGRTIVPTVRLEVVTAVGVLAATAVLSTLDPRPPVASTYDPTPRASGEDYARTIHLEMSLRGDRLDAVLTDLRRRRPVEATVVEVAAVPAARPDQAPARISLHPTESKHWTGSAPALAVPGRWDLVAIVTTTTGTGLRVPLSPLNVLSEGR